MIKKYTLEIIVFVSGSVVMILELTGSRILAPYAGTSVVVWTSLIGVILTFLSMGYFYGGKLADRIQDYKKLAEILLIAGIFTALINVLRPLGLFLSESIFGDIRLGSVFLTIFLFGPTSFTLGMIPIYSVRLKIKNLKDSGEVVGRLFALSTLGSISGTFLGGFVLIAALGNRNIIYLLSITLVLLAFISYPKKLKSNKVMLFYFSILGLPFFLKDFFWYKQKEVILDTDSQYSRIIVTRTQKPDTNTLLALFTGRIFYQSGGYQSAVLVNDSDNLITNYLKFFRLGEYFNPNIKKAMLIGGGAYTFPKDFIQRNPNSSLDVIELDSKITQVSKDYFSFTPDPKIQIYHEDGRNFINSNVKKYDAIYIDAYSDLTFPFHLVTKEATSKIYSSLNNQGVVVINVISSISGNTGKIFRSILKTYQYFFPKTYVFPVNKPEDPLAIQNIIIIAQKDKNNTSEVREYGEYSSYLNKVWKEEILNDTQILTDDYAPLEYYYLLMNNAAFDSKNN